MKPLMISWFAGFFCLSVCADEAASDTGQTKPSGSLTWQDKSVEYARIMSRVKWTPVAEGMPKRGGQFTAGKEYTGVPYSSVKHVGRYIGFDIFLKTFLAAVENPKSVLYTENLYGKVKNAECYYGKVCSSYTSYALQCGIWYVSKVHGPEFRDGVTIVEPQSAQAAQLGDIIFTPPASKNGGSHVEMVTEVVRNSDGKVTHVRIEESRPQTTSNTLRSSDRPSTHTSLPEAERCTVSPIWTPGAGGTGPKRFCSPTTRTTRRRRKSIASCSSIAVTGCPIKRGNP